MIEKESCACDLDIPVHATAAYRRALWLVVILNLAMGIAETGFGFLAGSQALKADALDFIGDGLITGLGLVALNWGSRQRAHTALAQGVFLALMGLGVMAATLYRTFAAHVPEANIMGVLGIIALAVNIACAAILLRFRNGDANVRAVWLFSRNDAIGNAAVIFASIAVGITATPWPDLLVAAAIAGLFIHSAFRIVGESRAELQTAN
jgi:Co/Zn/Cd efflux system component